MTIKTIKMAQLARLGELLSGSRYWKQQAVIKALTRNLEQAESPRIRVVYKKILDSLINTADNENAKVWGTRAVAGAGVAGGATAAYKLIDDKLNENKRFKWAEAAAIKDAAIFSRDQEEDSPRQRVSQVGLGLVGTGISGKVLADSGKPMAALQPALDAAKLTKPYTFMGGVKDLQTYMSAGHNAINTRVLGMPLTYHAVRISNPFLHENRAGRLVNAVMKDPSSLPLIPSSKVTDTVAMLNRGLDNLGINKRIPARFGQLGVKPNSEISGILADMRGVNEHYKLFRAGDQSMAGKHIIDARILRLPNEQLTHLGPALDLVKNQQFRPPSLVSYIGQLVRAAPTPEGKKVIMLATRNAHMSYMGGPEATIKRYEQFARAGGRGLKVLGAAGLALSAIPLIRGIRGSGQQTKAAQSSVDGTDMLTGAGLVGGSALAAHGVHEMSRPLDVGVTWGTNPMVGQGHAQPGKALFGILKDRATRPGEQPYRLTQAIRGDSETGGLVIPRQQSFYKGVETQRPVRGHTFDVMFDTGMGAGVPPSFARDVTHSDKNMSTLQRIRENMLRPKARLGGHVNYMTDIIQGSVGNDTAGIGRYTRGTGILAYLRRKLIPGILKDTVITYGPEHQVRASPEFITHRTSQLATPLISQDNIKNIQSAGSREEIVQKLLSDPQTSISQNSRKLLENLSVGGKKVMVISGSGRGDYVAIRALATQRFLEKKGLTGKVQLVTLLGGQPNNTALAHDVLNHPGIISVGYVNPKSGLFPQLPMLGDMHWGSSGTSSLYESLASPVPFALPPLTEAWKRREIRLLLSPEGIKKMIAAGHISSPAEAPDFIRKQLGFVDLDAWNRFNKALAFDKLRTDRIQTASQAVNRIMELGPQDQARAVSRARAVHRALEYSRGRLSEEIIPAILARARKIKIVSGAGKLGLGLTAAGLGATALFNHQKEKQL